MISSNKQAALLCEAPPVFLYFSVLPLFKTSVL